MTSMHQPTNRALTSALAALCLFGITGRAADLYVSPDGSDNNPGTQAKPFATLERVRDELRKQRTKGTDPGPRTVWLRGGDYVRTNTLELTAADSGTAGQPVTWRAFNREVPRLLGGLAFSKPAKVTAPEVLSRLPGPARAQVLECNLSGIGPLAEMKSRGFGRSTTPAHNELFIAGKPMTLARWPNAGQWEKIAGFPTEHVEQDGHGGQLGKLQNGFYYAGDRPGAWKNPETAWVHGYWAWDWANSYERISSIDAAQRLVKTAPPHGLYGFRKDQRFFFLNVLEELDGPGEYFVDVAPRKLYFWPPAGVDAGANPAFEVIVSRLGGPLIRLADAAHTCFRGLLLEATRSSAVEIRGGASNLVAACLIRNIGNYGVTIEGGTGSGVVACDILDTGDGGVSLNGGDRATLKAGGHYVENCSFARQGRWSKCYVPAVLMGGVGQRASHNLVQEHPHCAILFNGNDHLIEFNEIHHIALETGDVGAIYTGRDYTYRGNRIRHNFVHETGGVGMGSMGVYMDDCVSGTEIFGNVFYKVQRAAFLGGGRDHQVINNIFVECDHAVEVDGRGLDKSPVWHGMVNETMRRRLADVPPALYRERYPAMKALDRYYGEPGGSPIRGEDFIGVPPENNVVARNICIGKWLNVYWHAKPEMMRIENNLTDATSAFLKVPGPAPRAQDFALKPEALAPLPGFQPLPLDAMGLVASPLRTEIPKSASTSRMSTGAGS